MTKSVVLPAMLLGVATWAVLALAKAYLPDVELKLDVIGALAMPGAFVGSVFYPDGGAPHWGLVACNIVAYVLFWSVVLIVVNAVRPLRREPRSEGGAGS